MESTIVFIDSGENPRSTNKTLTKSGTANQRSKHIQDECSIESKLQVLHDIFLCSKCGTCDSIWRVGRTELGQIT